MSSSTSFANMKMTSEQNDRATELYKETRDFLAAKNGGPLYTTDQEIPTSVKMRTQDKIYSILKHNLKAYDLTKHAEFLQLIKEKMAITTQKRYYISDYGFANTKDYGAMVCDISRAYFYAKV